MTGKTSPHHIEQRKETNDALKGKWMLQCLRMMRWFFHPVWLSMSPRFSVACFLHSQRNITLDPTLAMYYHAVPLVSSRWHCMYGKCNVAL